MGIEISLAWFFLVKECSIKTEGTLKQIAYIFYVSDNGK